VAGKTVDGAALCSVRLVWGDKRATEIAGTRDEGAGLATFRSVCVGSSNHCGGGHDI
jgi:hypothetical protein